MMRSGLGASRRATPGRPLRGGLALSAGPSDFGPVDGGSAELSGVLAGRSSRASRACNSALRAVNSVLPASNTAIRASAVSSCPTSGNSDRISAPFSATLSLDRSTACVTGAAKQVARDRVKCHLAHQTRGCRDRSGATQVSNYRVFIERFILPILATVVVLLVFTNPMGFSVSTRIIGVIIIIAIAVTVSSISENTSGPSSTVGFIK